MKALAAAVFLLACTKADPALEARAALGTKVAAAPLATSLVVDVSKRSLTLDRYERLVLGLADCRLERYQIDSNCAAMVALAAALRESAAWADRAAVDRELGGRLIHHAAPAIRIEAARMLAGTDGGVDAIAAAAAGEPHAGVLQAFVRTVAHASARPPVTAMLLAAAGHADPAVRLEAVAALTQRAVPGGADKLAQLAERDTDAAVRQAACAGAGKLGDHALLAMYERQTEPTAAADAPVYAACMEGLVAMFHDHPWFDTADQGAYELFLRRIEATPRSEAVPPWSVMSTFCYFSHESDLDKLAAWKQRAPWFDAARVKRALASVIADGHASWMARAAAVESMVGLGATRDEIAALRHGLRASDPGDKQVLDKLASVQ